jgi:hypothetical protein
MAGRSFEDVTAFSWLADVARVADAPAGDGRHPTSPERHQARVTCLARMPRGVMAAAAAARRPVAHGRQGGGVEDA